MFSNGNIAHGSPVALLASHCIDEEDDADCGDEYAATVAVPPQPRQCLYGDLSVSLFLVSHPDSCNTI
jgi:hypothetical protein